MIFDKEGRKLIGSPKWPGASEGGSTLGMSDQSIPLRMTTGEVNNRGRNILPRLRGSNRAILGPQLQEAEVPGASEEGLVPSILLKFIYFFLFFFLGRGRFFKGVTYVTPSLRSNLTFTPVSYTHLP